MPSNKRWTPQETDRLVQLRAAGSSDAEIAAELGRTVRAVGSRRCELGLLRVPGWTADETRVLRESTHLAAVEVAALLDRPVQTVRNRRVLLGLRRRTLRFWTDDEVEFLRASRPVLTFFEIGCALGRSATSVGNKYRAL